jgi:hypothetical protein
MHAMFGWLGWVVRSETGGGHLALKTASAKSGRLGGNPCNVAQLDGAPPPSSKQRGEGWVACWLALVYAHPILHHCISFSTSHSLHRHSSAGRCTKAPSDLVRYLLRCHASV